MRMPNVRRSRALKGAGVAVAGAGLIGASLTYAANQSASAHGGAYARTPIKHVVVIYDENVSYDHYFGTYPKAANTDGTTFKAKAHTPYNKNLVADNAIKNNPNSVAPFRLTPDEALTCDQNHGYTAEQQAVDGDASGTPKMDKFPESVSRDSCSPLFGAEGLTMGYYDGNTVTAMWNYAQNFAMSDNSWDATFGPSTPGAMNVIAGQTYGGISYDPASGTENPTPATGASGLNAVDSSTGVGTVIGDPDPVYDDCSDNNHTSSSKLVGMQGKNIGDLLNEKGLTWGWFQGGFSATTPYAGAGTYAQCGASHTNVGGSSSVDYSPHHNPFAYYKSTANPHHVEPASEAEVGHNGRANHNYDLSWFDKVVKDGKLPAVSYVKAAEYQDGHAAYSDPIDEQHFLVHTLNELQKSPDWSSTMVVIAYDDSDGWYDHVAPKITNGSSTSDDVAVCTAAAAKSAPIAGQQDRCGPSQRLPLMVISPYSKTNYVSHSASTQASVVKFIEDNWGLGRLGGGSFDATAGSITDMLNLHAKPHTSKVLLDEDGSYATSPKPGHGGKPRTKG
ncbi:alkaline phosphatase family protein [Nocardioides sp. KR10-350]|uniref:phospholipase C n=1 Tax=Nocardioides cheoyonin TaxID=3156615 RepID=UPI0032B5AC30